MSNLTTLDSIDYARSREAQERAAAKRAETGAARRVHRQLAQMYAQMADDLAGAKPLV